MAGLADVLLFELRVEQSGDGLGDGLLLVLSLLPETQLDEPELVDQYYENSDSVHQDVLIERAEAILGE